MKELGTVEMITVFKGGDSITYLAEDFLKNGDNATPYAVRQNPYKREPFVRFKTSESESIMKHQELVVKPTPPTKEL